MDKNYLNNWKQTKNQKDWIIFRANKSRTSINIITYAKKFKWDLRIASKINYPIMTKKLLSKTKAMQLAKAYMLKNI